MRKARTLLALVAAGCVLAGCAHSRPAATAAPGRGPAEAALLACGPDGVGDISAALGAAPTNKVAMTRTQGGYACRYAYPAGAMAISVLGYGTLDAARSAMATSRPAGAHDVPAVGQEAYATTDGTIHVRKDALVLTVDVSALPATFGTPPHPRNIDAITVATAILACWTQA